VSHRSLKAKHRLLKELIECKEPTHFSSDDQKRQNSQKFSSIKQAVREKRGVQVKAVGFFVNPFHRGYQEEEEKVAYDRNNYIRDNSSNSVSIDEPSINQKQEEESKNELAEKLARKRVSTKDEQ